MKSLPSFRGMPPSCLLHSFKDLFSDHELTKSKGTSDQDLPLGRLCLWYLLRGQPLWRGTAAAGVGYRSYKEVEDK